MARFQFFKDPFEDFLFKFLFIPYVVWLITMTIYEESLPEYSYGKDYEFVSPLQEEFRNRERNSNEWGERPLKERKTLKRAGASSYSDEQWWEDLENADPESGLFREYMEELDDRGVEPGSPRAVEIWETYYK